MFALAAGLAAAACTGLRLLLLPPKASKSPDRKVSKGFCWPALLPPVLLASVGAVAVAVAAAGPAVRTSMARPVGSCTTERVTPVGVGAGAAAGAEAADMRGLVLLQGRLLGEASVEC